MTRSLQLRFPFLLFVSWLSISAATLLADVIVDDTWADGTRSDTNLPAESAWYASNAASLTTVSGTMTATTSTSSRTWWTYFTSGTGNPVQLAAGQTLKVSLTFTPTGVDDINTIRGLRIGLLDFSGGSRTTADGNSPAGAGVAGYLLLMNFGQNFGVNGPLAIAEGTNSNSDLMSSSSEYPIISSGGGSANSAGFVNGNQYTLEFSVTPTATAAEITTTVIGPAGWSISHTAVANTIMDQFDGFALRPANTAQTASAFSITRFKVEVLSAGSISPMITTQPQNQTLSTGGSATFSVSANGTAPLSYQWSKGAIAITSATNSSLTLSNVQPSDAGGYSVVVSNSVGTATSGTATLTVTAAGITPSIITQPESQSLNAGSNATFSVVAGGTSPLSYQWLKNGTVISSATSTSLTLSSVQATDAGNYTVAVTNSAGSITSNAATLAVNNAPPVITNQPSSQAAVIGSAVSLTVGALGSAPLSYQWFKDGSLIASATTETLSFVNTQSSDSGSYTATVTNAYGSATSNAATLTVSTALPYSAFNLTGFATAGAGTTGGGIIAETSADYVKVYTPLQFANAIASANSTAGAVKVIEIMNDLGLGWNEVGSAVQAVGPFRKHNLPLLHPALLTNGVSIIDMKPKSGLTIFSANGATIKHATFNLKSCSNIIIRNLKFDEMWEWDESTKGNYDKNDWDFIDLSNGGAVTNVWIDHCTFTKTYDGIVDLKAGAQYVTLSWCKYVGDDGATNSNSWVRQQINAMEVNKAAYPFYNFLRTNGFSVEDIVAIQQGHDKTHLMGSNSLDSANATLSATVHHQWFNNMWDRCVPRLRAGNVHNYNIYVDDTGVLAAQRLRNTRATAMTSANRNTLDNTYSFDPPINGSISTEGGALLVEKSVYMDCNSPLRNNQTDPSDPTYTGKIKGLDTIYIFHNTNGTTTNVRGNSTDAGNPLGPFQATVIPFSWNLTNNQLPYSYTPDDPAQLASILASGAGAGALTWSKDNWLKTTYSDSTAGITQQPASVTRYLGEAATFSVSGTSATPLSYQWRKNGVSITGATNASYTIASATWADVGGYSVLLTNAGGSVTSNTATLDIPGASYISGYGLDPAGNGAPTADPDNDGIANKLEWLFNGDPTLTNRSILPTLSRSADGSTCIYEFNRRKDAASAAYIVRYSTSLTNWTDVVNGQNGISITTSSVNATLDHVTVTIPATGSRLFIRVRY